jgi:DNA (cytosine-5)-methyltransferase 1
MAKSVELFAGGGGMALGMLNAGFDHEQLVEIYPAACETLRLNAERDPALWKKENVRQMDIRDWLAESDTKAFQGTDLLAGGPPCQPFSIAAGDNASHASEKNMFPAAADCVSLLQPKAFVFENVPGLLRESFLPYYEYIIDRLTRPSIKPRADEDWVSHHARIRKSRRKAEYSVRLLIVDAADLGIPQTRKRIFLIGIRADVAQLQTFAGIHLPYSRDSLLHSQWVTGDYWKQRDLPQPDAPHRLAAQIKELRRREVPPVGEPWLTTRDAIAQFPAPVDGHDAHGILNHKGIPGARTYRGHTGGWIDWPAKTLKAGVHGVCGGEAMIRFSDDTLRYLTVREAAAIQRFPNSYEFPEVRTVAMRLIGNAVATTVAEIIGRDLRNIIDGNVPEHLAPNPDTRIAYALDATEIAVASRANRRSTSDGSATAEGLW